MTTTLDAVPREVAELVASVPLWNSAAVRLRPVTGGLTNSNWLVHDPDTGMDHFLKVPGLGTDAYIDRVSSHQGAVAAANARIGADVLFFDPKSGIEVTEFLAGYRECTTAMLHDPAGGSKAVDIYRRLHETDMFPHTKTLFDMTDEVIEQTQHRAVTFPDWVERLFVEYRDVKARFCATGLDLVPSHNDPMPGNFMLKGDQMKIIDFDYAANNERSCDLALFLVEMFYEPADELPLIEAYFGTPTVQNIARVRAIRVVGDIKWGLWGIYNSIVRESEFDYWKYGMWKLGRASQYFQSFDWGATKRAI